MKHFRNIFKIDNENIETNLKSKDFKNLCYKFKKETKQNLSRPKIYDFLKWAINQSHYYSFKYNGEIYKESFKPQRVYNSAQAFTAKINGHIIADGQNNKEVGQQIKNIYGNRQNFLKIGGSIKKENDTQTLKRIEGINGNFYGVKKPIIYKENY
jgi:hypothetical protein